MKTDKKRTQLSNFARSHLRHLWIHFLKGPVFGLIVTLNNPAFDQRHSFTTYEKI